MVSKAYISNIFNKSKGQIGVLFDKYYCLALELPNGKVLVSKAYNSVEECKEELREKIREYEEYIELDKKAFGYELSEEYYNE